MPSVRTGCDSGSRGSDCEATSDRTVAYSTPEHKGISLDAAYGGSGGNKRSRSRIDERRWQATATYAHGDTRLAAGIDDRGYVGYGRNRLYGLSVSHKADKLYLAIKYEKFDTGNQRGAFSTDGNQAVNLFGSYVLGRNTIKNRITSFERRPKTGRTRGQ